MTSPARTPGGAPIRPEIQWRYLQWKSLNQQQRSKVTHALRYNTFTTGLARAAICGTTPTPGHHWRGAGTPAEHETTRRLRPCRKCLRALGLQPNTTERTQP